MIIDKLDFLKLYAPQGGRHADLAFAQALTMRGMKHGDLPENARTKLDRIERRRQLIDKIMRGVSLDSVDSGVVADAYRDSQNLWGLFERRLDGHTLDGGEEAAAAGLLKSAIFPANKPFLKLPAWKHFLEAGFRLGRMEDSLQPEIRVIRAEPAVKRIRGSYEHLGKVLSISDLLDRPDRPDLQQLERAQRVDIKGYAFNLVNWAIDDPARESEVVDLLYPFVEWSQIIIQARDNDGGSKKPDAGKKPGNGDQPSETPPSETPPANGPGPQDPQPSPSAPVSNDETPTAAKAENVPEVTAEAEGGETRVAIDTKQVKISTTVETSTEGAENGKPADKAS